MRYRLIGVVLLAVALSLTSDAFATASNLLNVLRQASLIFLSASGLTLVIVGAGLGGWVTGVWTEPPAFGFTGLFILRVSVTLVPFPRAKLPMRAVDD